MNRLRTVVRTCPALPWVAAISLLLGAGCDLVTAPLAKVATGNKSGTGSASPPKDVFTQAADDNPKDRPFLEEARPILAAIAARDYAKVYGFLSSHARAKINPEQFVPSLDPGQPRAASAPLENLSQEQFVEWMQKMEKRFAIPDSVRHVYVASTDPKVLAGQGDRLDVMLAIGGMPADIPVEIRKASIRAAIQCQFPEELVKQIAADLKISEGQARSGKWPQNDEYPDPDDERPYFNVKFVLVEEGGQLKMAYFEFMPPSIMD